MNFIISVINPAKAELMTAICQELGVPISIVAHGRGTAVSSMRELLGIDSDEKRIVFSVAGANETAELIRALKRCMHIGVPGHGIVTAVPVKSVAGGKTVTYLNGGSGAAKYKPREKYAYELIVAIANEGSTDAVMNAARAAGARGGTVIHGKGTGAGSGSRFYNISIADEKEVIMIVSPAEDKSAIMRSIAANAGPDTPAGAIVFSLPAAEVAGFGLPDDET